MDFVHIEWDNRYFLKNLLWYSRYFKTPNKMKSQKLNVFLFAKLLDIYY